MLTKIYSITLSIILGLSWQDLSTPALAAMVQAKDTTAVKDSKTNKKASTGTNKSASSSKSGKGSAASPAPVNTDKKKSWFSKKGKTEPAPSSTPPK